MKYGMRRDGAWRAGAEAYRRGWVAAANPHGPGTRAAFRWLAGWIGARAAAMAAARLARKGMDLEWSGVGRAVGRLAALPLVGTAADLRRAAAEARAVEREAMEARRALAGRWPDRDGRRAGVPARLAWRAVWRLARAKAALREAGAQAAAQEAEARPVRCRFGSDF